MSFISSPVVVTTGISYATAVLTTVWLPLYLIQQHVISDDSTAVIMFVIINSGKKIATVIPGLISDSSVDPIKQYRVAAWWICAYLR